MKSLILAPAERSEVSALIEFCPLMNLPLCGKALIEHWLEHLAARGRKQITILAVDRPEQVRALVADGSRWGLEIEVIPESNELTPDEAWCKYGVRAGHKRVDSPDEIFVADCLPPFNSSAVADSTRSIPAAVTNNAFASYADFFEAAKLSFADAEIYRRVGAHEVQPGVWVGLHSHVAKGAVLRAPCWIGEYVRIGKNCVIGPNAIIEDRAVVGADVEILRSYIGPETFVGSTTDIVDSMALASTLINYRTGSVTAVPDPFLMCALRRSEHRSAALQWAGRAAAVGALVLSAPLVLGFVLQSFAHGQRILRTKQAVMPSSEPGKATRLLTYYELAAARGLWRRWPQLWNIVCGEFCWVGNRPLSPLLMSELTRDFEKLWLAAPLGVFSLADAQGCLEPFGVDAQAHSSFYAVQSSWKLDWHIFIWAWWRALTRVPQLEAAQGVPAEVLQEKAFPAVTRGS